jgi:hypothetical protein
MERMNFRFKLLINILKLPYILSNSIYYTWSLGKLSESIVPLFMGFVKIPPNWIGGFPVAVGVPSNYYSLNLLPN